MAKFKKSKSGSQPAISTASLPDIVFMLLFFFMVSTVMRETSLKVNVVTPKATEVIKLEEKSLISYIYIGKPIKKLQKKLGSAERIQLNDAFASIGDIIPFVEMERSSRDEFNRSKMIWSLKVDENSQMGIVSDVKQELRKAQALKISYSTKKAVNIFN